MELSISKTIETHGAYSDGDVIACIPIDSSGYYCDNGLGYEVIN